MTSVTEVDVVVLGLGPGGEASANRLAKAGLRVVGVEQDLVGGECPFYGCNPSKIMLRAANTLAEARRVPRLAGECSTVPDWSLVAARIREEAADGWDDARKVERLNRSGASVVRGRGRLTGPRTVEVDGRVLKAARGVLVSTGTDPGVPPVAGLAGTPYWTNRDVVKLAALPRSLVVLGAGPIGCELAQVMARFGVEVTLVEVAAGLLAAEEPEAGRVLQEVFAAEGVRVLTGVDVRSVRYDGAFTVDLGAERVTGERLLVATGRTPRITDIGLDSVGVDPEAPALETGPRMRVLQDGREVEGLWAVGDITGKGAFTHTALYQSGIAVRDLLGQEGPDADYRAVPRVTYTDPEVGSVGLTEQQARDEGRDVRTGCTDLSRSARGWLHAAGNEGLVKLVAEGDLLLGATSVGPMGGEVLSMLTTAVHARVPVAVLRTMIYPYPTFHGAVRDALADLG
jgi:pyruvate/2-oxoglutarate dehydrogenase complex dihydrolipoamide dehydrogenase (E3) component